jgi:hypothetical protein
MTISSQAPKKVKDMTEDELKQMFRKHGITAKKWGGDDSCSWCIFVDGRVAFSGLARMSVMYYKKMALSIALKEAP